MQGESSTVGAAVGAAAGDIVDARPGGGEPVSALIAAAVLERGRQHCDAQPVVRAVLQQRGQNLRVDRPTRRKRNRRRATERRAGASFVLGAQRHHSRAAE
ncbi:MAG: hypothetical protein IT162_11880 [Bryobacterales bacterium]|nr:hypothetical protein [Bryobacterales bacterium]